SAAQWPQPYQKPSTTSTLPGGVSTGWATGNCVKFWPAFQRPRSPDGVAGVVAATAAAIGLVELTAASTVSPSLASAGFSAGASAGAASAVSAGGGGAAASGASAGGASCPQAASSASVAK